MFLIFDHLDSDKLVGFIDARLEAPAYEWITPGSWSQKTRIRKLQGVPQPTEIAVVEMHDFHDDVCTVHGFDRLPHSSGIFSSGREFTASNGRTYRWKHASTGWTLTDQSEHPLAHPPHQPNTVPPPEPACVATYRGTALRVFPVAYPILDEIVATAMYMEWRKQENDEAVKAAKIGFKAGS
ncbi:hypothetical protein CYLTODRAFT_426157 [Cylindrobasidium torrendii FP15055 ss-10]|uniref:DUF6593 domain-containing protein n=1 Tax=Cylindrobasidium torrendii FP15055 ss-10 TaxID=1314674 RepID=A0A0D7AZG8_9AGAR|nr:hypothetical protein CYLTODRAFT_426157 [Cylindrobasidium torrendii FP15055 ss-10]